MAGRRISRILVQVPQRDEDAADAASTEDDGLEVSA
jgi:hypothetical protein